ncbi:MAG: hypothetical protein IT350_02350 [Deltaproteobacteria bacterium]|nr:hypothetical protein [Deltaproteobacteria bacterium]
MNEPLTNLCVLIMAGGHGTRFWPWSSELLPKQFLPLAHPERSLLQQTCDRVADLAPVERIFVLTNREHVSIVRTQLPQIPPANIIGEPVLRDTAAAVGLGAYIAGARFPGAVQIVLPADHEIAPDARFREVIAYTATCAAEDGALYTLGIRPSRPSAAYGYLLRGEPQPSPAGFVRYHVRAFVEKPDLATAKRYVDGGEHDWNAGIFVWRADAIIEAISRRLPEHGRHLPEAAAAHGTPEFETKLHDAFLALPRISIDYGVMQAEGEAGRVRAVEGDFHWSDLGGWQAFADKIDPDEHDNRVFGHAHDWNGGGWRERWSPRRPGENDPDETLTLGRVFTMDSRDNLVFNNRRGHSVALLGVQGLAVVHTHEATLVTTRTLAEAIKPLVTHMPPRVRTGGPVPTRRVEKPWGYELWWGVSDDFAGKSLFVRAGSRLSLQYHVLKEEVLYLHAGHARVLTAPRGGDLETIEMNAGDALHVEPGRLHRLEAIEDCLVIESSTSFLWDVVRVADDYGREGTRAAEVAK